MGTKPLPLNWLNEPLVDPKTGYASQGFRDYLTRVLEPKTAPTLTLQGELNSTAPIEGRTEGIGTTAQNLTSTGQLASTDNIAADGTGSPLTGGKRGFVALDTNNRLAGTFKNNPLNVVSFFTGANPLVQDATTTNILVAASTRKFGDGSISYNSGSVDPGVLGGWTVYADDTTFAGGVVTYQATQNNNLL